VFEENAKVIYKNPYFMQDMTSEDDLFTHIQAINTKVIRDVTKSMVPIQQILETYMNAGNDEEHEIGAGATDAADPVAEDPMDSMTEPTDPVADPTDPMGEGVDPSLTEPSGEIPESAEELENHSGEEDEIRNVPVSGRGIEPSPEDDDDTLFGDAPEARSKNYAA
jgi:hypothetical protein